LSEAKAVSSTGTVLGYPAELRYSPIDEKSAAAFCSADATPFGVPEAIAAPIRAAASGPGTPNINGQSRPARVILYRYWKGFVKK
jgi:hypothetical protein